MRNSRYENYLLSDIEYWQLPYIGRTVNDKYALLFDHNGYYPSDDYDNHPEYYEKSIIINLKPQLSDNVIQDISYYKKVDHGLYSRHSDERPLNSHDIKVFKEVLDECTVSSSQHVLEQLLDMPLKEGWTIKQVSEKTIQLSHDGNTVSLPIDYAKQIIDIAPKAPDIISNDDFWEINSSWLRGKYKEAIFALLCNYNKDNFPEISFAETARERIDREDQEEAAKKALIHAIQYSQTKKVSELAEEIPEIPREAIDVAIKKGKTDYLMAFVSKTDPFWIEHIGNYAISKGETELLERVVEKGGTNNDRLIYTAYKEHRIDYVILLLKNGYTLHIRPNNGTKYDAEDILPLTDYSEVYFSADLLEQLYEAYGADPIRIIIENYHYSDFDWKRTGPDGYFKNETIDFVTWLIKTQNTDLIDCAVGKDIHIWISSYNEAEDLAISTFHEDGALWDHAKHLFDGNISISRCMKIKDLPLLEYCVESVSVSGDDLEWAIRSHVSNEMLELLIRHLELNGEEFGPDKLPLWHYGLKIDDLRLFELFFKTYDSKLQDDQTREDLYDHFVWNNYGVEKAKILVNLCGLTDQLIKDAELASVLKQSQVLRQIENELPRENYYVERIFPHKVIFRYYDDHTWEVIGKSSSSKWDTPNVEGLHYLASLVDGECVLKNLMG